MANRGEAQGRALRIRTESEEIRFRDRLQGAQSEALRRDRVDPRLHGRAGAHPPRQSSAALNIIKNCVHRRLLRGRHDSPPPALGKGVLLYKCSSALRGTYT